MFKVEGIESTDDWKQWLEGGWGFTRVNSEAPLLLTHFSEMNSNGACIYSRYTAWNKYTEYRGHMLNIETFCHWPIGGAINITLPNGQVGGVVGRIADRQYKRTCYPNLMTIEFPKMWASIKKFGPLVGELDVTFAPVMWALFFPEYPNARTALQRVTMGETSSVAISPNLLFVGDTKRVLIYDKMKHVGNIVNGIPEITYEDSYVTKRLQKQLRMKLEGSLP